MIAAKVLLSKNLLDPSIGFLPGSLGSSTIHQSSVCVRFKKLKWHSTPPQILLGDGTLCASTLGQH